MLQNLNNTETSFSVHDLDVMSYLHNKFVLWSSGVHFMESLFTYKYAWSSLYLKCRKVKHVNMASLVQQWLELGVMLNIC